MKAIIKFEMASDPPHARYRAFDDGKQSDTPTQRCEESIDVAW